MAEGDEQQKRAAGFIPALRFDQFRGRSAGINPAARYSLQMTPLMERTALTLPLSQRERGEVF